MAVAEQGHIGPAIRRPTRSERSRTFPALDAFDVAVLVAFAALSAWVLALDLSQVVAHDGVWAGTDGLFLQDQAMYLAWIRDASDHLLVSNLFVLGATPHDYLQPAIAISGGLVALGIAPWVALIAWQPVAVGAVFFAVRALIRRLLAGPVSRRTALVVALFGGSIGISIFPDFWLPYWSWGYPFALLGLAFALGSLMVYAEGRSPWLAALLAAMAAWLHPWIGEVLILIVVGGEGVMWASGRRPPLRRLALLLGGIALPLAYYGALGHFDTSWRLGENASTGGFPLSTLAFTLAPLAMPALLAYRLRPATFLQAAVRAWPPAAVVVFLLAEHGLGNSSMHGFLGIGVPLAVLAVEGVATLPRPSFVSVPVVAALAVLAVTVPVTISSLKDSERYNRQSQVRNRVTHGEWRALGYLAHDPQPGGVLTEWPTGVLVPGETGRHTYIGNLYWSQPKPERRAHLATVLLTGHMRPRRARAFVRSTGARFLLADCGRQRRRVLTRELAPMVRAARRFGCATLYELA